MKTRVWQRVTGWAVRSAAVVLVALCCAVLGPAPAKASTTCTFSGPSLTFGTISPFSGYPYSTSGNVGYSCINTDVVASVVYACVSIGIGTGGGSVSGRTLASGSSTLPIQITGGSAYPLSIGNGTSVAMEGPVTIAVAAQSTMTGTYPLAVYATQPSVTPPAGSYTSNFSGADAQNIYTTTISSSCAMMAAGAHSTAQANFSVMATVQTQCTVSATSLAFPTSGTLSTTVAASATISAVCNATTPVTIGIDNGATGASPTARLMRSGSNTITYGIYHDAAASLPWGTTSGVNTATVSSGTGSLTAFGIVPAQTSPAPGTYSDVVNVIITY